MDLSVALFFIEMLRTSCGGLVKAAQHWQAEQVVLAADKAEQVRAEALREQLAREEAEARAITHGVSGVRISPGAVFVREPIGLDPANLNAAQAGPNSILSTDKDELPDFLEQIARSGVRVESGEGETVSPDASASAAGTTKFPAVRYRLRTYTLYPPTPYVEPFNLTVPTPLPLTVQPLLVVFHKYGSSHNDVLQNTDFVFECAKRGWFMVCPLAGSKKHFGSVESQVNTQAVLDWLLANASLRIDRDRIYGIGFSMGGGAVLNYAARHRDPAHVMFAALINHSGGVSVSHTYLRDPPVRFIFDYWFGDGSVGSAQPWKMARSSVIDFDPLTLAVDTSSDLARNLGSTPIATFRASQDTIPYLPVQNDVLDHHFTTVLGRVPGQDYSYDVVPFAGHSWRMVDAAAACDWFAQYTLQLPRSGRLLADTDAVYEHFYVEQDVAGVFTPLDWSLDTQNNALRLSATSNLKRLTIDPIEAGLSTTSDLRVFTASADGSGDEIVIRHWLSLPSAITRDGIATTNWICDTQSRELTLFETDGAPHAWVVTP